MKEWEGRKQYKNKRYQKETEGAAKKFTGYFCQMKTLDENISLGSPYYEKKVSKKPLVSKVIKNNNNGM